jgi:hypothetical protein
MRGNKVENRNLKIIEIGYNKEMIILRECKRKEMRTIV